MKTEKKGDSNWKGKERTKQERERGGAKGREIDRERDEERTKGGEESLEV